MGRERTSVRCGKRPAGRIAKVPAVVAQYADGCVRAVQRSLGMALEYDPETISLLDHYLTLLPDRPRSPTRDPVRGLVATMAGVYFGEVVRHLFPSRWVAPESTNPLDWRLEFEYCFLTFFPVAIAWEVILRRDLPTRPAAFLLDESTREQIAERLDRLPGATLEDYYTFAQRLETLVLVAGWLVERVRQSGKKPAVVAPQRYVDFLERTRTP